MRTAICRSRKQILNLHFFGNAASLVLAAFLFIGLPIERVIAEEVAESQPTETQVVELPSSIPSNPDTLGESTQSDVQIIDVPSDGPAEEAMPTTEEILPPSADYGEVSGAEILPRDGASMSKELLDTLLLGDQATDEGIMALAAVSVGEDTGETAEIAKVNAKQITALSVDSNTGNLTYAYPLQLPEGRGKTSPSLLIQYSAQTATDKSAFGYGWNISIPSIERVNKGGSERMYASTTEYFRSSLSGELVRVGTTNTYRTKVEAGDFFEYKRVGDGWEVTDKFGTTYFFGTERDARQDDSNDATRIAKWMLERVEDTAGNFSLYTYTKDQGMIYPASISYTGFASSTGIYRVTFGTTTTDAYLSYDTAFPVTRQYLVNEIELWVEDTLTRVYSLRYEKGANGARNLLGGVTEIGIQDDERTPRPETVFKYTSKASNPEWVHDATFTFPEYITPRDTGVRFGDVNGDGLTDMVRYVRYADYDTISSRKYDYVIRRVHINKGEGKWDINVPWDWSDINIPFAFDVDGIYSTSRRVIDFGTKFVDVNGDGRDDIVVGYQAPNSFNNYTDLLPATQYGVYINNGSGFVKDESWEGLHTFTSWNETRKVVSNGASELVDVNGDSLPDIVTGIFYRDSGGSVSANISSSVKLNTGHGWVSVDWFFPSPFGDVPYKGAVPFDDLGTRLADVNGDGLVDVLRGFRQDASLSKPNIQRDERSVYLNTGNGWATTSAWALPVDFVIPDYPAANRGYHLIDINGDKLPDIVKAHCHNDCYYEYYENTGYGWRGESYQLPFLLNSGYRAPSTGKAFVDFDGDTIADVLDLNFVDFFATTTQISGGSLLTNSSPIQDLLTSVTLPEGGTITATLDGFIDTAQQNYSSLGDPITNPVVVSSITYDSGFKNVWKESYVYEDGHFYFDAAHPEERRFAGFGKITETDDHGITTTYYHQGNDNDTTSWERGDNVSKIGVPYRQDIADRGGDRYKTVVTVRDQKTLGDGATFIPVKSVLTMHYDGDTDHRDTAESYTYDESNGNMLTKTEWGEVVGAESGSYGDVGTDKRVTTYTYAKNDAKYILGLPSSERLTDHAGKRVRESQYFYDNRPSGEVSIGNLTKKSDWVTGSLFVQNEALYNEFGLKREERDPRGNVTRYSYDKHNLFPEAVTDALGHTNTYAYDYRMGKVATTTDANGYVRVRSFDPFGRTTAVYEPQGASGKIVLVEEYAYEDKPKSVVHKSTHFLSASSSVESFVCKDGFGRTIQSRTETEVADVFVIRDTIYGDEGKVALTTLPYEGKGSACANPTSKEALYTSYGYDALGRVKRIETILGETKISHDEWVKSITDVLGHTKMYEYDAFTRLNRVTEKTGTSTFVTRYDWTPHDALATTTDAYRNIRRFTYDGLGRRLTAEDLHKRTDTSYGVWRYAYDPAGNIATTTDPKGQVIKRTYDAQNRIRTEDFTRQRGIEIRYTYDTCINGIGYLCTVQNDGATTTRTYTPSGRLASETVGIDRGSYITRYTYDYQNNVLTTRYPDTTEVRNTYNAAGKLDRIELRERDGSLRVLIADIEYSPTGNVAALLHGNGVRTKRTYDDRELYRLKSIVSTSSAAGTIQRVAYTYDKVGNIVRMLDTTKTASGATTTYTYDDLYRLTSARAVGGGKLLYNRTYTYDGVGNILSSNLGAYTYGNTNFANPHAVTRIATTTYKYDRNGNLASTTRGLQNTYNYRNRLIQSQGDGTALTTYAYDAFGARVKKVSPNGTTYYVGSLYERNGPALTKHIYAGDMLVADILSNGTTVTVYHTHLDHLGSTRAVTDAQGRLNQVLDYYPYGDERVHTGTDNISREYIGQVTDAETKWNYLNARYYDGARGQFLSQDPVFWEIGQSDEGNQILIHPQLQNSYAYAGNNPIVQKDPDGRFIPLLVGAWALAEMGLSAYDGYTTYKTVTDPNATKAEKSLSTSLFVAGVVGPGGGYGAAGKTLIGQSFGKVGTVIENTSTKITGFTTHGLNQTINRGVSPSLLLDTTKNAEVTLRQSGGNVLYLTNKAGVVLNKAGEVVTSYTSKEFKPHIVNILKRADEKKK